MERFTDLPIDRYITIVEGLGKWTVRLRASIFASAHPERLSPEGSGVVATRIACQPQMYSRRCFAAQHDASDCYPDLDLIALVYLILTNCNADWGRHRQNLAGGRQVAGLLIDLEDHDVIAGLIGGQQVAAAGRDFKVAWCLASGGDVFQQFGCAGCGIEGEDGNAVVPAVRAVEKFAGRVRLDFRSVVVSAEALGQS